ncbi:MAG TPA: glyoxalase [Fibrobacteres bacterium]|nr:glyoxalase [Fibrobacterota bacterium]
MQPRLSLITLGVSDLKKSRKFYEKGLGFPVRPESQGDVVFFGLKTVWLGLYPRKLLAEDAQAPAKGSGFQGITLAHNVKTKKEVDELMMQAVKAGAKVTRPAQEVFWGGYTGYFADPDGYLWEIAYNPHFWIE